MECKEQTAKSTSIEEKMRTAGISDATRDYLILLGKLYDACDDASALIDRDYGSIRVDDIVSDFQDATRKAWVEVEKWLLWSITERLGDFDTPNI